MASAAQGITELTRAERVRRAVMTEIVRGNVAKGDRLDEVRYAAQFGVSRTPVREAFRLLAAQGWVEARPHRGVFVMIQGDDVVRETAEATAEIMAVCVRLTAHTCAANGRDHLAGVSTPAQLLMLTPNQPLAGAACNLLYQFELIGGPPVRIVETLAAVARGDAQAAEAEIRRAVMAAGDAALASLTQA